MRLIPILLLFGCGIDLRTVNREKMNPPLEYEIWYQEVERCLSQTGNFALIKWFVADSLWIGEDVKGGAIDFPHEIIMRADHTRNMRAVKHEMIHHITQRGDRLHGTERLRRCSNE